MPARFQRESVPYADVRAPEDRRQEERRWTDQDEARYQQELIERKQHGYSQGEAQRTLYPGAERREDERRQQDRRMQDPTAIPCPACNSGVLQGPACTNCGITTQQIIEKPTSRDASHSPADPDEENKTSEDFDTEDSVLDALEEKVLPEGKKRKEAIVSVPPGGQEPNATGGPSYPPGAIVPPAEGGPSMPPEGEIPHHETAQPFVGYEGVDTGNSAVDQQVQFEIMNRSLNPEQARQLGLQRQQESLRQQHQEGWTPQNLYQVHGALTPGEQPSPHVGPGEGRVCSLCHSGVIHNGVCSNCKHPSQSNGFHQYRGLDTPGTLGSVNPVGDMLSRYDHGFVSQSAIDRAKKLVNASDYGGDLQSAYENAIRSGDRAEADRLRLLIEQAKREQENRALGAAEQQ